MTYTYVILEVSKQTFDEIKRKLTEAEYEHVFHDDDDGLVIDMQGIALQEEKR
jgi:hypothetical protein